MKIRTGHVSNSSSSSFILHKSEVTVDQWNGLISGLDELENNPPQEMLDLFNVDYGGEIDEWGDSGRKYDVEGNYLIVETNYIYSFFDAVLKRLGIDARKAMIEYR